MSVSDHQAQKHCITEYPLKAKILCVVLIYYEFQHIRRAVDALINTDALDLVVVENKSEHTDTSIKPYSFASSYRAKLVHPMPG